MTEITSGIYNAVNQFSQGSLGLAVIFFIGHVLIAMTVVSVLTGASLFEAGLVALVEPAINSVWFYVLHKIYNKYKGIA